MGAKGKERNPKKLRKMLEADGWFEVRKGPGDHIQFKHNTKTGRVTLDMGAKDIPTGTLKSVYQQAGWEW